MRASGERKSSGFVFPCMERSFKLAIVKRYVSAFIGAPDKSGQSAPGPKAEVTL